MTERRIVSVTKITSSWRVQFPADVRRILEAKDGKAFTPGDKIAFYQETDGRIVIERA